MTSSMSTLVARILATLLILLVPPAARSQEQTPPQQATPAQEKPADGQPRNRRKRPAQARKTEHAGFTPHSQIRKVPAGNMQRQRPQHRKNEEGPYLIKQGDTLWDISHAFLKDPFLWPFIWKANTYIANPDLIYPGNKLAIPDLAPIERAMQAPVEQGQQREVEKPVEQTASTEADVLRRRTVRTAPTGTGILRTRKRLL